MLYDYANLMILSGYGEFCGYGVLSFFKAN